MVEIVVSYCKITKGFSNTLVCDLLHSKWWVFPNVIGDLINTKKLNELNLKYKEIYNLLVKENLIQKIPKNDINYFTELSTDYDYPGKIQNAIIDFHTDYSSYNMKNTIFQLEKLGCQNICFRFFSDFDNSIINNIKDGLTDSSIEGCEVVIEYKLFVKNFNFFISLRELQPRFMTFTLYNSPEITDERLNKLNWVVKLKSVIVDSNDCGQISPLYFTPTITHICLSSNHNNCLYKKIGIDINGNIKNCPTMKIDFGNLSDTSIMDAIKDPKYIEFTHIKKSQIDTCKVCEFRDICSDCRAFLKNPLTDKPQKCTYNPYKNTWE
jgi:SPASM domain peptide maturase of grasp-with-spasm system